MAAGELVEDVGLRADYNEVFWRPPFLVYYVANGAAFLWLGFVLVHRGLVRFKPAVVAAVLGTSLELLYATAGWVELQLDLISIAFGAGLVELLWFPGYALHWLLLGEPWCRWCDGLVDAPVRLVMLEVATLGCLNGLGWYGLTALALALRRRRG